MVPRDRFAWLSVWLWFAIFCSTASAGSWEPQLDQGVRARSSGDIHQSVEILTQAVDSAPDKATRTRAMTQLGLSLLQAGRLADAERTLQAAYDASTGAVRISIALALGNVAAAEHDPQRASAYHGDVLAAPTGSPLVQDAKIAAQLNLARLQPLREKFETLEDLYPRVEAISSISHRARALFINRRSRPRSRNPIANTRSGLHNCIICGNPLNCRWNWRRAPRRNGPERAFSICTRWKSAASIRCAVFARMNCCWPMSTA
jgi:hypothetical protein